MITRTISIEEHFQDASLLHVYPCYPTPPFPALLATLLAPAAGSSLVPYWTFIFQGSPLRRLRDHVQHPLPSSSITTLLQLPRSLSATERVGRCDPETAETWSVHVPLMSVRQPPFTRDIAESGAPCGRTDEGSPSRDAFICHQCSFTTVDFFLFWPVASLTPTTSATTLGCGSSSSLALVTGRFPTPTGTG